MNEWGYSDTLESVAGHRSLSVAALGLLLAVLTVYGTGWVLRELLSVNGASGRRGLFAVAWSLVSRLARSLWCVVFSSRPALSSRSPDSGARRPRPM